MTSIIITIIAFVLDIIFSNILPFMREDLSIFTTLLVPVTVYLVYPLYKEKKNYLIYSLIVGIVYDLIFTNLLFIDAIIFLLIGVVTIKMNKLCKINSYLNILYIVGVVIMYEVLLALGIGILNLVPITIPHVLYKIINTLLSNIIYGVVVYFIIDNFPKRIYINK